MKMQALLLFGIHFLFCTVRSINDSEFINLAINSIDKHETNDLKPKQTVDYIYPEVRFHHFPYTQHKPASLAYQQYIHQTQQATGQQYRHTIEQPQHQQIQFYQSNPNYEQQPLQTSFTFQAQSVQPLNPSHQSSQFLMSQANQPSFHQQPIAPTHPPQTLHTSQPSTQTQSFAQQQQQSTQHQYSPQPQESTQHQYSPQLQQSTQHQYSPQPQQHYQHSPLHIPHYIRSQEQYAPQQSQTFYSVQSTQPQYHQQPVQSSDQFANNVLIGFVPLGQDSPKLQQNIQAGNMTVNGLGITTESPLIPINCLKSLCG